MSTVETERNCTANMEERLAKFGAKIDQLIVKADHTRQELESQVKWRSDVARQRSESALVELKQGLDRAWVELNHAWEEIRESSEKATNKLLAKEDPKRITEDESEASSY